MRFMSHNCCTSLKVQISVTLKPTSIDASILLNKLRLIGLFDLLLMLKSFVIDKLPEEAEGERNLYTHQHSLHQ